MTQKPAPKTDLSALNVIRTETALSRYPVHRIAKRGDVSIEIRNAAGVLVWEVSYNSKYGQPGPLAYKLDTLVINRRIDEAGKPTPKLLRLGSLADIAGELDMGRNTTPVKNALFQNAFTAINARMSYKGSGGGEKTLEAAFTRYSVVLTGEQLPDGRRADAVYLVLNEIYMEVLNNALSRPLDYDYLKALPPASQRFYEIVSYQMYAALRNARPRAKLSYAEYCTLSTQMRYLDFDHVKKQMYKVHLPHIRSGYLAKVEYEATVDEQGAADWNMFYAPGPAAIAEYEAFTGSGGQGAGRTVRRAEAQTLSFPFDGESSPQTEKRKRADTEIRQIVNTETLDYPQSTEDGQELTGRLVEFGVASPTAERLARELPESVRAQLTYWPERNQARIKDPIGWLIRAIERGHPAPRAHGARQSQPERERKSTHSKKMDAAHKAANKAAHVGAYYAYCAEREKELARTSPQEYAAFAQKNSTQRRGLEVKGFSTRMWDSLAQKAYRLRTAFPDEVLDYDQWEMQNVGVRPVGEN